MHIVYRSGVLISIDSDVLDGFIIYYIFCTFPERIHLVVHMKCITYLSLNPHTGENKSLHIFLGNLEITLTVKYAVGFSSQPKITRPQGSLEIFSDHLKN